MKPKSKVTEHFPWLGLIGSLSTLICCVLPLVLVTLGLGGTLISLTSALPGLVWLSSNKILVFAVTGTLILGNAFLYIYNRNQPCPVDPLLRQSCLTGRTNARRILIISVIIYLIGFMTAFVVPLFL